MLPLVTAPGLCPGSNGALTSLLPPGIVFKGTEKRADMLSGSVAKPHLL